jgi:hypothetical protein
MPRDLDHDVQPASLLISGLGMKLGREKSVLPRRSRPKVLRIETGNSEDNDQRQANADDARRKRGRMEKQKDDQKKGRLPIPPALSVPGLEVICGVFGII